MKPSNVYKMKTTYHILFTHEKIKTINKYPSKVIIFGSFCDNMMTGRGGIVNPKYTWNIKEKSILFMWILK